MRATLFTVVLVVSLAAGAGLVGVLSGRTLADAPGEYARGIDEGQRLGRAQARRAFRPGHPAYDAAVRRARDAAYAEGRRDGRRLGAERGRRTGVAAAFAGFEGGWDVDRWYAVTMTPGGRDGTDLRIGQRLELTRGRWYGLCSQTGGLCERPRTVASRRAQ
jgi:hypothetical protein